MRVQLGRGLDRRPPGRTDIQHSTQTRLGSNGRCWLLRSPVVNGVVAGIVCFVDWHRVLRSHDVASFQPSRTAMYGYQECTRPLKRREMVELYKIRRTDERF